jgi:CIC family chloride channel protein
VNAILCKIAAPALIGILTGTCVAGLVGGVEQWALSQLAALPGALPALFAPLALLLTWLVSRYVTRVEKPTTSELYITTYHQPGGRVPLRQIPGRILATTTTVGLGGSQGFESTSALIGATWSDLLARTAVILSEDTRRSLLAAGASAGIAAVFSSPAAGALYGIEVPYKRDVDAPRLVPCAIAAVCSYAARTWLIGSQSIVTLSGTPQLDLVFLLGCLLVAIACGLGARLFAMTEEVLHDLGRKQSRGARALIGGTLLALLAWSGFRVCGTWITFGSGYVAAGWLLAEPHLPALIGLSLLIRAGGNLVCVYGGGGGGVFTSLACNGAFLGEAVARLLGCDETHTLALFGAACFLGAGYRLPLACMLFVAEASGSLMLTAAGLAVVAIGQVLMGNRSVSEAQLDRRDSSKEDPTGKMAEEWPVEESKK